MVVNGETIRELERSSIREFVYRAAAEGVIQGDCLDFGCGRQPYRDIVEGAGARYWPYDAEAAPGSLEGVGNVGVADMLRDGWYDTVLCTQVLQYAHESLVNRHLSRCLKPGGHLVLTGPTNWPEVETADRSRLTLAGVKRLLEGSNFEYVLAESRAQVGWPGFQLSLGYGVIARKR